MKSSFDFVTAGRLTIGFGALLFLMALAEFLGWVSHRPRWSGVQRMLFGLAVVLIGVADLQRTSWERPTPPIEWAGLAFMTASVAMMAYRFWTDRRAKAGDKAAR